MQFLIPSYIKNCHPVLIKLLLLYFQLGLHLLPGFILQLLGSICILVSRGSFKIKAHRLVNKSYSTIRQVENLFLFDDRKNFWTTYTYIFNVSATQRERNFASCVVDVRAIKSYTKGSWWIGWISAEMRRWHTEVKIYRFTNNHVDSLVQMYIK